MEVTVNSVKLTHSNIEDSFRLLRLKKVLNIWENLSDDQFLIKPYHLHDHKGCLEVFYNNSDKPSLNDKDIFQTIWGLFNEYEIVFNK